MLTHNHSSVYTTLSILLEHSVDTMDILCIGKFLRYKIFGPFRFKIFEDGPLVTIDNNGTSVVCVIKI